MTGIIYYNSNFDNGLKELRQMTDRYENQGIPIIEGHYMQNNSYARFENGDIWRVCRALENVRGYKCNIAYIERSIDIDTYCRIIAPSTINFPYSAFHLWGEGNLCLSDIPSLPF